MSTGAEDGRGVLGTGNNRNMGRKCAEPQRGRQNLRKETKLIQDELLDPTLPEAILVPLVVQLNILPLCWLKTVDLGFYYL